MPGDAADDAISVHSDDSDLPPRPPRAPRSKVSSHLPRRELQPERAAVVVREFEEDDTISEEQKVIERAKLNLVARLGGFAAISDEALAEEVRKITAQKKREKLEAERLAEKNKKKRKTHAKTRRTAKKFRAANLEPEDLVAQHVRITHHPSDERDKLSSEAAHGVIEQGAAEVTEEELGEGLDEEGKQRLHDSIKAGNAKVIVISRKAAKALRKRVPIGELSPKAEPDDTPEAEFDLAGQIVPYVQTKEGKAAVDSINSQPAAIRGSLLTALNQRAKEIDAAHRTAEAAREQPVRQHPNPLTKSQAAAKGKKASTAQEQPRRALSLEQCDTVRTGFHKLLLALIKQRGGVRVTSRKILWGVFRRATAIARGGHQHFSTADYEKGLETWVDPKKDPADGDTIPFELAAAIKQLNPEYNAP